MLVTDRETASWCEAVSEPRHPVTQSGSPAVYIRGCVAQDYIP